ncbi:hypothetical protein EI555_010179 [Monodon monoceros]|uniref:Uncharacterized protein n=1 Tax=Monodon monoceros TaxID=40151 RepID=A0A4U1FW33_MONMO|nr:hypothetical protein EI555_010179 [Monodon monoceros]
MLDRYQFLITMDSAQESVITRDIFIRHFLHMITLKIPEEMARNRSTRFARPTLSTTKTLGTVKGSLFLLLYRSCICQRNKHSVFW